MPSEHRASASQKKKSMKVSHSLCVKPVTSRFIVSKRRNPPVCVGYCDMQSRSFDLCPTVNIHTVQNAVCAALHGCFLPAQWRCHTGTCLKPHPHPPHPITPTLEPLEETWGGKKTQTLWSALLWVTPVCDDNESGKEGNDFVSDWELIYEGPVNWRLLWGDAYRAALLLEVWLSSSSSHFHDVFMTESNFLREIFMRVTLVT